MRNLKKVLALALATVMLLGIMAIASAADYTDEAAIADKYAVAVDVMTAVGVFEGDPAGNFNPAAKLTREQAAKIAVYVALTKETAQHVTAVDAPFSDVAAARWSAGSIVAAKNLGLIDGWNGKFDPTGDLTGYAFAKMLLGVLGYKAENEGFLGAGWEVNVNLAARDAGLLKDMADVKLADALTREQAAQMALNALKAKPVVYQGSTNITIAGVTIANGGEKKAEKDADGNEYANLAAKLYPTLTWDTKVDNAFGYATIQYKYGTPSATVATAKNYTVLATYAGDLTALTNGALYNLTKTAQTYTVYVNGADAEPITAVKDGTTKLLAEYTGAVVEVVKNDGAYEILVSNAEVAKVASVTAAAGENKRKINIDGCDAYETESFAKDEYIFIWKNGSKIIKAAAIADADKVVGTATQVDGTNGRAITGIYVAGTKYAVAGTLADDTVTLNKDYTVYFQNGYAIDAKQVAAAAAEKATIANYVYVTERAALPFDYEEGAFGAVAADQPTFWETQVVFLIDGTAAIVNSAEEVTPGYVYEMDENDDGFKTFKAVATDLGINDQAGAITMTATTKYYDLDADTRVYFTENTKVLTIETRNDGFYKAATLAAPAKTTMEKATFVYSFNTTAKVYEVERIVTPVATAAAQDLYYVVGTLLGTTYDATAKKSYDLYTAYDLATGDKLTVKVANGAEVSYGFFAATVKDGVYTFAGASAVTAQKEAAAKGITVYNNLLTAGGLVDVEVGKVTVVDATGGTVNTIAALAAKSVEGTAGKAVEFHTVTIADVLTYIVVTKY